MLAFLLALLAIPAHAQLPWDVLSSPSSLPRLFAGDQVLLRSSRCPSGCRYDRTSSGDTRFLYEENGEQVLFEEAGPGAITRIWMTTGHGFSEPLDPAIRIRIRLEGETAPRVDIPLSELFGGAHAPFTPPFVADRLAASGGYVSYLPIPYRRGCRVSLTNAHDAFLWFQFTFHRLPQGSDVATFTGLEDLSALRSALLSEDPWESRGGAVLETTLTVAPGTERSFASLAGPGLVTALRVEASQLRREELRIRLLFDGRLTTDVSLAGFFAAGRRGATSARGLLVGEDVQNRLYSLYPMPFFERAEIRIANAGNTPADARVSVRRLEEMPPADSAYFGAQERRADPTSPPADTPLLALSGRGKWVGLFAEAGSIAGDPEYLEGDERVTVDGSPHPAWYGTGVEDFFCGGFSFDRGPFALPLCGMSYRLSDAPRESVTAMWRLLLTDALPFERSIDARLENGPTGRILMRLFSTAFFYFLPGAALEPALAFDVADSEAAARAGYEVAGGAACAPVTSAFESEPMQPLTMTVCSRAGGRSRFLFPSAGLGPRMRLRRRLDVAAAGQGARVFVDGVPAGSFPPVDANPYRRFREQEIEVPLHGIRSTLLVEIEPEPMAGEAFTEIRWEVSAGPRLLDSNPLPLGAAR